MSSNWARFWAVDLHVHTPGSGDAKDEDFGTAADIVKVALDAGLDAIAVTDHNTAAWCGQMAAAAMGTDLVVLPGFELSTPQGHLLGIWEEGTAPSILEDVLIRLGIQRGQLGSTDVVASKGMAECAAEIVASGGIAVAAHIDKERGILKRRFRLTSISCLLTRTSQRLSMSSVKHLGRSLRNSAIRGTRLSCRVLTPTRPRSISTRRRGSAYGAAGSRQLALTSVGFATRSRILICGFASAPTHRRLRLTR